MQSQKTSLPLVSMILKSDVETPSGHGILAWAVPVIRAGGFVVSFHS